MLRYAVPTSRYAGSSQGDGDAIVGTPLLFGRDRVGNASRYAALRRFPPGGGHRFGGVGPLSLFWPRVAAISRRRIARPGRRRIQRVLPPKRRAIPAEHRTARYAATLLDREVTDDGSTAMTLALDDGTIVLARARTGAPALGTQLIVRGRLAPFDGARNPGEPSERAIEHDRSIDGRLDGAEILSVTGSHWSPPIVLARLHEWAHDRLRERLDEPAASVLAGELWGERSALPPLLRTEFKDRYRARIGHRRFARRRRDGALPLRAIAGRASPLVDLRARHRACMGFRLVERGELPAERAATMASFALIARACGRATFSFNSLAGAATVAAFLRPQSSRARRLRSPFHASARSSPARRRSSARSKRTSGCPSACGKG